MRVTNSDRKKAVPVGCQSLPDNTVVVFDYGESFVLIFREGHPRSGQLVWRHLSEGYKDAETFTDFAQFLTYWI
ncbi:hypothetical protein [Spartinivicinus poritis]|uniref:Uncharacterized protein n=1 Tax=Spartinivicinus poritis TaxID=2994640 RepID=A0ABT5UEM1_9GAMM|nr:hypothetical protein [Spartinivicinus sp. A2-2]MDE1464829.1 hypothetical protein [Spartinivicinus sp. A2-2]